MDTEAASQAQDLSCIMNLQDKMYVTYAWLRSQKKKQVKMQVQNGKKLVGKDQMFINNLQVKCKTSPEQQKTIWKRPDVYKQLASQMRDLSSLNDSIYMHASQVQEKKNICPEQQKQVR